MKITLLAFGVVKDIVHHQSIEIDLPSDATVAEVKLFLEKKYPRLKQLASYMLAINNTYAKASDQITSGDEVAIIPPVSGG